MKKIFAFFGKDFLGKSTEDILNYNNEGYEILALDADAIEIVNKYQINFFVIEDFLPSDEIHSLYQKAEYCRNNWYQEARDIFTIKDICWPEFDRAILNFFWFECFIAKALIAKIVDQGYQEFRIIDSHDFIPSLGHEPSNVSKYIWKKYSVITCFSSQTVLNKKCISIQTIFNNKLIKKMLEFIPIPIKHYRYFRWMILMCSGVPLRNNLEYALRTDQESLKIDLKNTIVIIIGSYEITRFTPLIDKLYKKYTGNISVILLGGNSKHIHQMIQRWDIKIWTYSGVGKDSSDIPKKFAEGYRKIVSSNIQDCCKEIMKEVSPQFKFLFDEYWPSLIKESAFWDEFWSQNHPGLIISSSIVFSGAILPLESAKKYNIPVIVIQHGGINSTYGLPLVCDYAICCSLMQKRIFVKMGTPEKQCVLCKNFIAENEYPSIKASDRPINSKYKIVILTSPIYYPGLCGPLSLPRTYMTKLKQILEIPSDIKSNITIKIKPHPGWPELGLLYSACQEDIIYPPNIDINSIIENNDIFIAFDYIGSALIQIIKSGKPILYYSIEQNVKLYNQQIAGLFSCDIQVIPNSQDLWDVLREIVSTGNCYKYSMKSKKFADLYLEDSHYPTIEEIVSSFST